jgi:hypothetical protein
MGLLDVSPFQEDRDGALDRYLAGEASAGDLAVLARSLDGRPAGWAELACLREVVRGPIEYPPMASGDEMWARLAGRVAAGAEVAPIIRWRRRGRWVAAVGALAASLVMAVALGHRGAPIGAVAPVPSGATGVEETASAPLDTARTAVPETSREVAATSTGESARPDVARAPYDGTPLEAGGVRGDRARAMSLADDAPGAADTSWP